jgi:ankyrin repeat protein
MYTHKQQEQRAHDSPLLAATENGHYDIVPILFQVRADVNLADCSGNTALMMASGHGRDDVVRSLLQRGADVNAATTRQTFQKSMASRESGSWERECECWMEGVTALMMSSKGGHVEVVRTLLEHGADVTFCSYNKTALDLASPSDNFSEWQINEWRNDTANENLLEVMDLLKQV